MSQLIDLGKLRFYFTGQYDPTTTYEINDIVKYGGNVYVYTYTLADSGILPTDTSRWQLLIEGIRFQGNYNPATSYRVGEGVAYGGTVYLNVKDSTGVVPTNATNWTKFLDGIQYEGVYSGTTPYQKSDMVTYGPNAYIAKQDTTGNLPTNATFWTQVVSGISVTGVYSDATAYVPGQVAAYGARLYQSTANQTGVAPAAVDGTVASSWQLFNDGTRYRGTWVATTQYYANDIVNRGGSTYIALQTQASTTSFATDLAAGYWRKYNSGVRWRGALTAATEYRVDDIFTDGVTTFIATADFTTNNNSPQVPSDYTSSIAQLAKGADYLPSQTAQAGKYLTTDGTTPRWVSPRDTYTTITLSNASVNTQVNTSYAVNTTSSAATGTINLPTAPAINDFVKFMDFAGTWHINAATVDPGSLKVNGVVDSVLLNIRWATATFVYTGTTQGWRILL